MKHPLGLVPLGLGVALALAGCDSLKSGSTPATPTATAAATGADQCGASAHQDLIGMGAGSLDSSKLPKGTLVHFPGVPAAKDSQPTRMNVSIGAGDKVDRVYCG